MTLLMITIMSAGVVLYASFCRLSMTSRKTITTLRISICLLAATALLAMVAPFVWGWAPDPMHAALLTALALHQVVTRKTWQHGVPEWFMRRESCH